MVISITRARHRNAEKLAEICKRSFDSDRDYGSSLHEGGPPGYDDPVFHGKLMGWVQYHELLDGDQIVGGISVSTNNPYHHELAQIFVDPDHHRKGVGSTAMRLVEEKYSGVKMWTLGTPSWNTRTKAFYESLGYVIVGKEIDVDFDGLWYQKTMDPDDPYIIPPIDQLRRGQTNVDVEGEVINQAAPRKVKSRDGRDLTVANSVVSDETGSITLVQWNHEIKKASVGDRIRVERGSVKSFRGEMQLSTGYAGHIIKLTG